MPQPWSTVEASKAFQELPSPEQMAAKQQYFQTVVTAKPAFQKLAPEEKQAAASQFLGGPVDPRSRSFEAQMTKGMYDTVPFGKDLIKTLDPGDVKALENTPPAEGLAGEAGKFVGSAGGMAPAYVAGEGLIGPAASATAKLAAGSAGVGVNAGAEASSEGATPKQAILTGAGNAAATFVGGKVLQGIGGITQGMRDVSSRIQNNLVRLPLKAFNYGKDPMAVFNKENITGNTLSDYADNAANRLTQRSSELNNAIAGSDKKINAQDIITKHLDNAEVGAGNSLQDRTDVLNKLETFKQKIGEQYKDLSNLSIQDAVKLKRQLANDFPFTATESKASVGNIMAKTAHQMYHDINVAVETAHPEIADLNQRVSGLIDITKAADNRVAVESRNNPIGLIGGIMGIGGYEGGRATGHSQLESIGMGLASPLIMKALASPAVLTRVASALSRMADVDKINLFKAAPWFMDVAQKAHQFVQDNGGISFAGKVTKSEDIGFRNPTANLEGMDAQGAGKPTAEPEVSEKPPEGNPLDIGAGSDQMVGEGAPATQYAQGKEGQTSIQNLRIKANQPQPEKPILNASGIQDEILEEAKKGITRNNRRVK